LGWAADEIEPAVLPTLFFAGGALAGAATDGTDAAALVDAASGGGASATVAGVLLCPAVARDAAITTPVKVASGETSLAALPVGALAGAAPELLAASGA
jgi:hypothetical protein